MKKVLAFVVSAALMLLQSGCYDSREIDETAYIIAIGIDGEDGGGYKYTFQFAAPLAISGEGGGGESGGGEKEGEDTGMADAKNPGVKNTVVKAADFYVARNMLNNFLSKNIDMSHLKMIVFSAKIDDDAFVRHSRLLRREREVRPHTVVAVAKTSAEEFLRCVNPELEANTAKYYELMSLRSNNIYAPSKRLHEFADELSSEGSSVLPLALVSDSKSSDEVKEATADMKKDGWVKSDGDWLSSSKSELRGMMVFKDGNALGEMDGDSALVYNILRRDIEQFTISIESRYKKEQLLTFDVTLPSAAHYAVCEKDGKYTIRIQQEMTPRFVGDGLPEGYRSKAELTADFCTAAEKQIESFMYTTARKYGADIMQTGNCLKKKSLTTKEWEKLDWRNKYKDAVFSVSVDAGA